MSQTQAKLTIQSVISNDIAKIIVLNTKTPIALNLKHLKWNLIVESLKKLLFNATVAGSSQSNVSRVYILNNQKPIKNQLIK